MFGANRVEERNLARRNQQARQSDSIYQSQIAGQNLVNMSLQNEALRASIEAMSGRNPLIPRITGNRPWDLSPALAPGSAPEFGYASGSGLPESSRSNFPSLAEIQSMIESSQKKAEEDFMGKINLLQSQEQQKQEEDQLSARNAASRMQSYQRQSAIGAWESALRGR